MPLFRADDQFTVAHALMTEKLDVKGIIAGHFVFAVMIFSIAYATGMIRIVSCM